MGPGDSTYTVDSEGHIQRCRVLRWGRVPGYVVVQAVIPKGSYIGELPGSVWLVEDLMDRPKAVALAKTIIDDLIRRKTEQLEELKARRKKMR